MSRPLRVLQVTSTDLVGHRFNGLAIGGRLEAAGIESRHLVWDKRGDGENVAQALPYPGLRVFSRIVGLAEAAFSRHARWQAQSWLLAREPWFQWADVVHYHLIHDGWFAMGALPGLARLKPSVWTWHDPWPMTGHCIYPIGCDRWRGGCGECPRLDLPFPMLQDRTAEQFAWKRGLYDGLDIDVVLASDYMMRMAEQSPLAAGLRLHKVPFGVDLDLFSPGPAGPARERLGVRPDRVTVALRLAETNPHKGAADAMAALRLLGHEVGPLCILSTQDRGRLNGLMDQHQVVDLGWVQDDRVMVDVYRAADMFLMPSHAEAFGMMAVEAMACGKPVICYDDCSLPEVTGAPGIGIAIPRGDHVALAGAIRALTIDPEDRVRRGLAARAMAMAQYDQTVFAGRLAELYRAAAARRGQGPAA